MKSIYLLLVICLVSTRTLIAQSNCNLTEKLADKIQIFLKTDIGSVLPLLDSFPHYKRCLDNANHSVHNSTLQLFLDLAYVNYQRTAYQQAVDWSSVVINNLDRFSPSLTQNQRENIIAEHCFYLYWNSDLNEIKKLIREIKPPRSAFIEGLLAWSPRGSRWQKADSLFSLASVGINTFSPRLQNELIIWKAQNLLYSTDNQDWQNTRQLLINQLPVVTNEGNKIAEIWLRYQLGYWGRTVGNLTIFKEQFQDVLQLNDEINLWPVDHPFRIRIINALAVALEETGDTYAAKLYINQAVDYHRSRGEVLPMARRELNKAKILQAEGQLDSAVQIYNRILPVFFEHNRMENAYSTLNNLSNTLLLQGNFHQAIEFGRQALELKIKEKGEIHDDVAIAQLNMGSIYYTMSDLSKAEDYWILAENTLMKMNRQYGRLIASVYNSLGDLHRQKEEWDTAENYYQKAIVAVTDEDSFIDNYPEFNHNVIAPLEFLNAQLKLAELYDKKSSNSFTYHSRSDSLFNFCIEYLEHIRFNLIDEQSKQSLQDQALKIYHEAIRFQLDHQIDGYLKKVFELIEKSKSYQLKNKLKESTLVSHYNLPSSIIDREEIFKKQLDELRENLNSNYNGSDSLRSEYNSTQEKLYGLQQEIKDKYPNFYLERYQNKATPVEEIQNYMTNEAYVLNFYIMDDELICLTLNKNQIELERIPLDSTFEIAITKMLMFLSDPTQPMDSLKSVLGGRVLTSIAKIISQIPLKSDLTIIPHQILSNLPFELLILPGTQSLEIPTRGMPYIFRDYTIHYAYTAGSIIQPLTDSPEINYLGTAPVCCEQSGSKPTKWQMLPHSRDEINLAAKYWTSDTLFSSEATKDKFLTAATEHQILHLATHALVDQVEPVYHSKLIFYDDQKSVTPDLYMHELYHLKLNSILTVLSACNTGLGKYKPGEGMLSLARAFRYANCPNIATSLWSVNDQSTSRIMSLFFQHLKKGSGMATALSLAKLEYLKSVPTESEYQLHPYYWAGFILIGGNQPIIDSTSQWKTYGFFPMIIGIALLIIFYYQQRKRAKIL